MSDYKRITMREFAGVTGDNIYNRLAELEDKIESGALVEVPQGAVVLTPEEREEEMRLCNEERKQALKECLLILYKHVDCCPTDAFSRGWNEAINTAFKEISETYGVSMEDEE